MTTHDLTYLAKLPRVLERMDGWINTAGVWENGIESYTGTAWYTLSTATDGDRYMAIGVMVEMLTPVEVRIALTDAHIEGIDYCRALADALLACEGETGA